MCPDIAAIQAFFAKGFKAHDYQTVTHNRAYQHGTENQLQQLPRITPAIAKEMGIIELNKFLLDQKLTQAQATEF